MTAIGKTTGKPKKGRQGDGGGRPPFAIDYARCRKLARIQCTQEEIAFCLGCSVDTLQRDEKFNQIYTEGMAHGRMSVRRAQYRAMLRGDNTMLIWLGKQYLQQREPRHEITGANGAPLIPVSADEDLELSRRAAFMLTAATIAKASASSKEPSDASR